MQQKRPKVPTVSIDLVRRWLRAACLCVGFGALPGLASPAAMRNVEWPVYGGDGGAQKFSSLADIHRGNVAQLRLAWSWETGEEVNRDFGTSPGIFETTPLVLDGVMYLSTPYNQVVALDAVTGQQRWRFDPGAYREGQVPNGMGFVHRGVALWRDDRGGHLRVLINSRHRLIELDAVTGKPVDGFGDHGVVDLLQDLAWPVDPKRYTNTSPPLVWKNLVIVGNGVADRLVYRQDPPGDVRAFDARTGRRVWSFHTVPRAGEAGSETWTNGANAYTGHTNVWAPMSVDERRGLLYLPVSTPSNDFYGGNRPGDGLYGDSLVCLDAKTGRKRWHRQLVHHGLWDYDPPAAPTLVTLRRDGHWVDAVIQLTKQGLIFGFDRQTGRPLWPIEERPVPASDVPGEVASPTQPFPVGMPALVPQGVTLADATDLTPELHDEAVAVMSRLQLGPLYTPPSLKGTLQRPGLEGGADWGGGAFDPDSATLYVKVNDAPEIVYPDITDAAGNVPAVGPNDSSETSVYLRHRIPLLKPPYAYLDAVDLEHGTMRWQVPFGDDPAIRRHKSLANAPLPPQLGAAGNAGVLATRGGVVFVGGGDMAVHAVDASTGQDVWRYDTSGLKTTGTPMTYRVAGHQYVAIAVGGPGSGARLLVFALP